MDAREAGMRTVILLQEASRAVTTLRAAAEAIADRWRAGTAVVVVVSTSGDGLAELVAHAARVGADQPARELDQLYATEGSSLAALLAMGLHSMGIPAVSLDGSQAGIRATGPHGAGAVDAVHTDRILLLLAEGSVVVVAGAQGVNRDGDIVTLGPGGSDLTADALAEALGIAGREMDREVEPDRELTEGMRHEHVIRPQAAAGADVPRRAAPARRAA
jgi:aspartate kinase